MQQWSEIRRRVLTGELSKRAACREYQLSWHTLAKMLEHDEPPGYRLKQPRKKPTLEPFLPILHEILEADKKAPKKQRHTATRIFHRLRDEHGYRGSYTTVRTAVREWKRKTQEVFLPLSHPLGEAQVNFGFAEVDLAGERQQVALFLMTLPYSDAFFMQAFPRECTESFQEGHKRSFEFFGGVPTRISYDNSKIAVAKITGSRDRKPTREFLRLQSHFLYESHFCLVRRANEKGHVENLVGYGRRNFLVPVPKVDSLIEFNAELAGRCTIDLDRTLRGKAACKRQRLQEERTAMLDLPRQSFDARKVTQAAANSLSLVRFDTNSYSVPVKYAHRKLTIVASVDDVRLVFDGRRIARHLRPWGREQHVFEPIHYLALLEKKPGGLDYARPLESWNLPECFSVLRRRMETEPSGLGSRQYIRTLRLLENTSLKQLTAAVEYALDIGIHDADSIRVILEHRREAPVGLFSLDGRPHLKTIVVRSTGGDDNRPGLKALQQAIFMGEIDTVAVWKLDRISRSLKDGVNILCDWLEKDIKVISVAQQLDFNGTTGKIVMPLLFALADMEKQNIIENTKRGLVKARKRLAKQGRNLGRPPKFKKYDITKILRLREEGTTVTKIANKFSVSKQTIYTALKEHKEATGQHA